MNLLLYLGVGSFDYHYSFCLSGPGKHRLMVCHWQLSSMSQGRFHNISIVNTLFKIKHKYQCLAQAAAEGACLPNKMRGFQTQLIKIQYSKLHRDDDGVWIKDYI